MRSSLWIAAVMMFSCVLLAGTQCKRSETPAPPQAEEPQPAPPKPEAPAAATPPVAETPERQPAEVTTAESTQEVPSALELVKHLQSMYKFPTTCRMLKDADVLDKDGVMQRERWEVWLQLPGRMRIDNLSEPGVTFVSDFGRQVILGPDGSRKEFKEPIYPLLLMLDIFVQQPEEWVARARRDGVNVDLVSVQPWHDAAGYYVIGDKKGGVDHPQVWLDRETLLPHLFLQRPSTDEGASALVEGRAPKYKVFAGGWTFPSVFKMYSQGQLVRTEVIKEIDFEVPLKDNLFKLPAVRGKVPKHQKEVRQQEGSKETG